MRSQKTARAKTKTSKLPKSKSGLPVILKIILWLLGGSILFLLLGISLFRSNLSTFFPVHQTQTLVFVSSSEASSNLYLVHLLPAQQKIDATTVSGQIETTIPAGYGVYKISNVFPLLKLEKKNTKTIQAAYSWILGEVADAVIELPASAKVESARELRSHLLSNIWHTSPQNLSTLKDKISWYLFSSDPTLWWDLDVVENQEELAAFSNKPYVEETCSVAVINTSQISGLAKKIGQILENSGLLVVRTSNDTANSQQTQLLYNPDIASCKRVAARVNHLIFSDAKAEAATNIISKYRADVVLLLGEDMESW